LAQPGRVGRADVDRQIIGDRTHRAHTRDIIGDGGLAEPILPTRTPAGRHAVLVGADVDADDSVHVAALLQPVERRGLPAIVEAEAIDHRAIFAEAEQPRLVVARLRARRDRSDLDETEAERQHVRGHFRVLVEAGCEANRRAEVEPGDSRLQRIGKARRQPYRREL
jgi:hypothetical protein